MNEPHIYCSGAYEGTWSAPGLGLSGTGGYGCVHNMILAHAKAYHLYNDTYKPYQGGTYNQPKYCPSEGKGCHPE